MPTALLNAHAEELPRISASESLLEAERVAVGAGHLKRGTRQRITSAWQREARSHRVVLRPKTREEHEAYLAMSGLKIKRASDG